MTAVQAATYNAEDAYGAAATQGPLSFSLPGGGADASKKNLPDWLKAEIEKSQQKKAAEGSPSPPSAPAPARASLQRLCSAPLASVTCDPIGLSRRTAAGSAVGEHQA